VGHLVGAEVVRQQLEPGRTVRRTPKVQIATLSSRILLSRIHTTNGVMSITFLPARSPNAENG
jgi:hypothetical protein